MRIFEDLRADGFEGGYDAVRRYAQTRQPKQGTGSSDAYVRGLVREMTTGSVLDGQRNAVLVGGTGTGKMHLSVAIALSCIRLGRRVRFYTVIGLVNRLEAEARTGKTGRLAEQLTRLDLIVLDELGYLPFAQSGGQLLFHLISRLYEQTSVVVTTNLLLPNGRRCSTTRR